MTTDAAVRKEIAGSDTDEAWRAKLERYLLMRHEEASQSRAGRRAHRLPFLQCRQCDAIRTSALASRSQPAEGAALPS